MSLKFSILSILISALVLWGCGKGQEDKVVDENEQTEESPQENDPQSFVEGMKQMTESLTGNKNVEPVDFRSLKELLPEEIEGLKRSNASGEKTAAFGINISKAEADYSSEDGSQSLDIAITDMGSMSGLTGLAAFGWAFAQVDRETDTGYERTTTYQGHKAFEKYNNQSGSGEFSVIVADRFIVEINGYGVTMDQMKQAISSIDVGKLEAMKNEGEK
ncbi:MAG: hypothetical protein Kow0098_25700 [Ignavibacteriaceae bacterium]